MIAVRCLLSRVLLTLALFHSGSLAASAQQSDSPLWTTVPTRVDRARQSYERLPARQTARDSRIWLLVPERIKVIDSISFSFGDGVYQVAHIRPIPPKRLCQAIEGGRWACGRMASIFLGNLVRGKRLLCDVEQQGKKVMLDHCVIGSRDVAAAIVSQGFGMAEGDDALLAVQAEAQKLAAKGLWRNPKCTMEFDTC
jgi:endonuclease YncB( thermonuclease family)